jgi:hypothetical protein
MAAARNPRTSLRNGIDFVKYKDYTRALRFLREAEKRQDELDPAERNALALSIAHATKMVEQGSVKPSPAALANSRLRDDATVQSGAMALADDQPSRSDSVQLTSANQAPFQLDDAAKATEARAASNVPASREIELPGEVTTSVTRPREVPTTTSAPLEPAPAPLPEQDSPSDPRALPMPSNGDQPNPVTPRVDDARPVIALENAPNDLPPTAPNIAAPAPPASSPIEPLPEPNRIPRGLIEPSAPELPPAIPTGESIEKPRELIDVSAPAPAPAPLPVAPTPEPSAAAPEQAPRLANEMPVPVEPTVAPTLADQPNAPQPSPAREPVPATPPEIAPLPTAAPVSPLEAVPVPVSPPPPPALEAEAIQANQTPPIPSIPEAPTTELPMPVENSPAAASAASLPAASPGQNEVPVPPELQAEVARIAARRQAGVRTPGTRAGGSSADDTIGSIVIDEPTEYELPRPPSSTEARPLRRIPVPEEFVPLAKREWEPYKKYWAAPATCHMPLYFQDVALERYGNSVETYFGAGGRFLTYPVDDPKQSKQRNQILQPFFSAGLFAFQVIALPYNIAVDPPWEAEYDLGYYRPGDRMPRGTYYLPLTGVGPPLHGRRY